MSTIANMPVALLVCLLLAACSPRSTEALKDQALLAVVAGDAAEAAATVNQLYDCHLAGEPARPGGRPQQTGELTEKHHLLWRMERGSIALADGEAGLGEGHLVEASRAAHELRSRSKLAAAATWIGNETTRGYHGAPHEHVGVEYGRVLAALARAQMLAGVHRPVETEEAEVVPVDARAAAKAWEHAIIAARGLGHDVLRWIDDIDGNERYRDDGFARLIAGVAALAMPDPLADDRQFAVVQLDRALQAYEANRRALGGERAWRYEVAGIPRTAQALRLRAIAAYDDERLAAELGALRLDREQATAQGLLRAPGQGSVLIVHEWGFCARRFILDVRIAAGHVDRSPSKFGYRRHWGAFAVWGRGPDVAVLDTLIALPLPGELAEVLAPGGLSYIGFAIPVHEADRPVPSPARIGHRSADGIGAQLQLEVAGDFDAVARATLKEHQPGLLTKTLLRVVAKQLPVALAAREQKRRAQAEGRTDLGALLINLVGSSVGTLTEIADTRCWTMLPGHVELGLLDLPPGEHRLTLLTADGRQVDLGSVTIQPGGLVVLPVRSFTEPPLAP